MIDILFLLLYQFLCYLIKCNTCRFLNLKLIFFTNYHCQPFQHFRVHTFSLFFAFAPFIFHTFLTTGWIERPTKWTRLWCGLNFFFMVMILRNDYMLYQVIALFTKALSHRCHEVRTLSDILICKTVSYLFSHHHAKVTLSCSILTACHRSSRRR